MKNKKTLQIQLEGYPNDGQRKGQAIFNFLEWLRKEKGLDPNQSYRMADIFFISNERFDDYWDEYIKELLTPVKQKVVKRMKK